MGSVHGFSQSHGRRDSWMNLTEAERRAIEGTERLGASLSLLAIILVVVTYSLFKRLRTVPNTFILFASVANVGASVACLIGYSGIEQGDRTSLCQTQAFLLETFMQSDSYWSLAMALNVYLVFFHAKNPNSFRRYLWVYCVCCYGIPMLLAVSLLAYSYHNLGDPSQSPVYGNATLWCWIGDSFNAYRIYTYYLPIWLSIFASAVIYIAVGIHVFHQRNQLRNLTLSNQAKEVSTSDVRESGEKALAAGQPYGTVTTEFQVHRSAVNSTNSHPPCGPVVIPRCSLPTPPPTLGELDLADMTTGTDESTDVADVNDTTPSAGSALEDGMTFRPINYNRSAAAARRSANRCSPWDDVDEDKDIAPFSPTSPTSNGARFASVSTISTTHRRSSHAPQKAFLANVWGVLAHPGRRFEARLRRLDPVKLAYLRTSFVFALSVLVTWTPSSINRVYTLAHPQDSSFGLNMASAVVLPLQGVWNCVIYSALSWAVLLEEVTELGIARGWWFPRPQVAPSMRGLRRGSERLGSGADGLPSGTPLDYHLAVPAPATQRGSGARGRAWDVPGEDGSRDIEMMGRGSTAGCGGGGTLRVFRGGSF